MTDAAATHELTLETFESVVPGGVRERSGLAERRERRIYDAAILLTQSRITDAQVIHRAWKRSFDDYIAFAGELEQDRASVRLFDIERNAALVGVEVEEI